MSKKHRNASKVHFKKRESEKEANVIVKLIAKDMREVKV